MSDMLDSIAKWHNHKKKGRVFLTTEAELTADDIKEAARWLIPLIVCIGVMFLTIDHWVGILMACMALWFRTGAYTGLSERRWNLAKGKDNDIKVAARWIIPFIAFVGIGYFGMGGWGGILLGFAIYVGCGIIGEGYDTLWEKGWWERRG